MRLHRTKIVSCFYVPVIGDTSCDTHWGPQSRSEQYEYGMESGTISGHKHWLSSRT